jgi:hypothetical protein
MVDIDSRLDARLRSFYEYIEQQSPPRKAAAFETPLGHARRRSLNLLAGVAGIAVFVAGVSVFAAELSSHHGAKPPTPAGPTSGAGRLLPSASQLTAGLPSISHTVIQVTRGSGSATLPTFTPEGMIFIQWSCAGSGPFSLQSTNHLVAMSAGACDDGATSGAINGEATVPPNPPIDGKPLSLKISAGPSTVWEIVIADSGPVLPLSALGGTSLPAGARILVPATYGTGTSGVETFVPKGPFSVQYACTGSGTIDFSTSDGSSHWVSENCANGAVGTEESVNPTSTGLINLTVKIAPPKTLWEVVIYEMAGPKA